MKRKALKTLIGWVRARIADAPIEEQIHIYEALGQLLPSEEDRKRATEIAVTLSEVAKLQLDFNSSLFSAETPKHDGDGHNS